MLDFWTNNYNTKLKPEDEQSFQQWLQIASKRFGRDLSNDLHDYDLRGYWLNGGYNKEDVGHMPDTYKKPNHPSFSDESIYSGTPDMMGGKWEGGKWIGDDKSGWSFAVSRSMLKKTHDPDELKRYFDENEPDVSLVMPTKDVKQ